MNLYIVTGTTKGLGRALAEQLAASAANDVVTLSRSPDAIAGVRNCLVDLTEPAAIPQVLARALAECRLANYAKLVLINNAGVVSPVGLLENCDAADLDANIRVNLTAPLVLMQAFLIGTRDRAVPRLVINISSGAGKRPIAGWTAYCAAKAGVDMATRVAALEAADSGLIICSLAPGVVDTQMQATVRSVAPADFPDVARFQAMKADGTLRTPADVAAQILRLEEAGRFDNGGIHDLREMPA